MDFIYRFSDRRTATKQHDADRQPVVFRLPKLTPQKEISGPVRSVTGSCDGTETPNGTAERLMGENFAENEGFRMTDPQSLGTIEATDPVPAAVSWAENTLAAFPMSLWDLSL